jgi:hypothetical protein
VKIILSSQINHLDFQKMNKNIKELTENQDYIRQQNNSILEILAKQKLIIDTQKLIEELRDIRDKINKIENIILS